MVERIEQRAGVDCQTAVAAMLADDQSYDDLAATYGTPMSMGDIVTALGDEGLYYNLTRATDVGALTDLAHYHDRLYVTIESPISERDPAHYWELASGNTDVRGESVNVCHALAIRDGEVLDPKPDPYFESWRDLRESPYEIQSVSVFSETEPRTLDCTH